MLKPFDIVRVFGRFDFEDPPVITVTGEVRDPGDHLNERSRPPARRGLPGGRNDSRRSAHRRPGLSQDQRWQAGSDQRESGKALEGDAKDNIALEPKDRVFIHRDLNKLDPPTVAIEGEVARPGKYPLGERSDCRRIGPSCRRLQARCLHRRSRPDSLRSGARQQSCQ